MSVRDRERLISRIRQIRHRYKTADQAAQPTATGAQTAATDPPRDQLRALETRVEHLEALVQGLQDSVHREMSRQSKRITELDARTQPTALGKALSDDARARGL